MTLWRAGLAVAAILLGAMAVLVGAVMTLSALREGRIHLNYGEGAEAVREIVGRNDGGGTRFWLLVATLGGAPIIFGGLAVAWGWRTISG